MHMSEEEWKWLVADIIDHLDEKQRVAQASLDVNKGSALEGAQTAFHFALGEKTICHELRKMIFERLARAKLKREDQPDPPKEAA